MRDLVWELHVANHFPSVWKPVNAFRLSKRVSGAPAANSLPPNCEAHFVTWSGRRRERSTPKTANNAASVRACNKRTEGTCLNFRARPLLTQKDGLYIPPPAPNPPPPPLHHHHHPLPPHPTPPPPTGGEREKKKKKNLHTESSTVHALFYLVLVDVMGKLSLSLLALSLSPSLPPAPSLRLSCAWDMLMLCTEQLKHA